MYTDMEQWNEIRRRIKVEGASKRSVMRAYGLHFRTLQKVLAHTEPPGYRRREVRPRPKLGPYLQVIEAILEEDKRKPPKQRHTARRIYDRLRREHATGVLDGTRGRSDVAAADGRRLYRWNTGPERAGGLRIRGGGDWGSK